LAEQLVSATTIPDGLQVKGDHVSYPFAEDVDGVWHVRKDAFWDDDIRADVRAHAVCGPIWSCHISGCSPVLGDRKARHCAVCFPRGRRRAR
jgi:hypothetical protein